MPYVTSIERIRIEKGRAEGLSQGQQQGQTRMLQKQLARRFGAVPGWAEQRISPPGRNNWKTGLCGCWTGSLWKRFWG